MKRINILLIAIAIFLVGCNSGDKESIRVINDPYHQVPTGYSTQAPKFKAPREDREREMLLAKMKSQEALEIAKIEAQSNAEIKRIETEALRAKVLAEKEAQLNAQKTQKEISQVQYQTQKDIASSNQKVALQTKERDLYLYRIITAVVALLILIIALLLYLSHRKTKATELKMQEDKIKHEQYTQASNQYHEKTNKMLDIISAEDTDRHVKKELIRILRYQEQNKNQILIPTTIEGSDNPD
jgi:preprotein translocase subunit SecG